VKHLLILNYIYLIISLYGCSVDNDSISSYSEAQHSVETGITLESSTNMWVSFPEMVQIYKETEACLNLYTYGIGPTVMYHDIGDVWGVYDPTGSWSVFYGAREESVPYSLIVSNPDAILYNERNKRTDTETLSHEFIHHILNMNGHEWRHINSEPFANCGQGVNTYN